MNNRPEVAVYLNSLMQVKYMILLLLSLSTAMVYAQRKPKIRGNRNVTEVSKELPGFLAVCLLDDLEVSLERAPGPGYEIVADDNLIDILKFEVTSDTLFISSFYKVTGRKQLQIRVRYNELNAITVRAGSISVSEPVTSDLLSVRTEAGGRLQLNARVPRLLLRMQDQSSGDFNIESDSLEVVLTNSAEARIYQVNEEMELTMGDQSDALIEGTAGTMTLKMEAGSKLRAERLEADTIKASLGGTASAYLHPTGLFELSSKESPNIYLYGDAEINIVEFGDTSVLYKRTE